MSRVNPITESAATPEARAALAEIRGAFGAVPTMFATVAHSPAALGAMWGAFKALGGGRLGAALGEQIAVAVADRNRCDYCLAALGRKAGVSAEAMAEAQAGRSADPRTAAALAFAVRVVESRAQVTDADVAALRAAGFDEGEVSRSSPMSRSTCSPTTSTSRSTWRWTSRAHV
jgi:uncharacterized peroxidase-related enzyme